MSSQTTTAGGRGGARRLLCACGAIVLAAGSLGQAGAGAERLPQVTVHEAQGVYTVAARFTVPQARAIAHAVLTDYEQIPQFMPDVTTSIVRERLPHGVVVEQEAVSRMMLFSKRIHLLLQVCEEPDAVRFRDQSGRSFSRYEGAWRLDERGGETVIRYELSAKPSFAVPEFLLKRLLRKDAHRMIDRLRGAIAARASIAS